MCFSSVTFLYRPDRLIPRVSLQHFGSAHMLLGFTAFTERAAHGEVHTPKNPVICSQMYYKKKNTAVTARYK